MRQLKKPSAFQLWSPVIGLALLAFGFIFRIELVAADDSDLPSAGRSAFDHFVAMNGGKVPYPPEKLMEQLKNSFPESVIKGTQIPLGRSLSRFSTDADSPRTVIALFPDSQPFAQFRIRTPAQFVNPPGGQLFIGYSEASQTLEVISYNPREGRYEFQVVTEYGPGQKPAVKYASRALCTSCHQNRGPIFPQGRWKETAANEAVARALKPKTPFGLHQETTINVDEMVRVSDSIIPFQDSWVKGCGSDPVLGKECRRAILEIYLKGEHFLSNKDADQSTVKRLHEIMKKTWPKDGIEVRDSFLDTFDPAKNPPTKRLPGKLDPLTPRKAVMRVYAPKADHLISAVNSEAETHLKAVSELQSIIDPESLEYINQLTGGDPKKIDKILSSPKIAKLLEPKPLVASELFSAVLEALGKKPPADAWKMREKKMPPAVADSIKKAAPGKPGHPISYFKKYCAECHSGSFDPKFNFMNGTDEEVWDRIVHNPRISERLDWDKIPDQVRMPPPTSDLGRELRGKGANQTKMLSILEAAKKGCGDLIKAILKQ